MRDKRATLIELPISFKVTKMAVISAQNEGPMFGLGHQLTVIIIDEAAIYDC